MSGNQMLTRWKESNKGFRGMREPLWYTVKDDFRQVNQGSGMKTLIPLILYLKCLLSSLFPTFLPPLGGLGCDDQLRSEFILDIRPGLVAFRRILYC